MNNERSLKDTFYNVFIYVVYPMILFCIGFFVAIIIETDKDKIKDAQIKKYEHLKEVEPNAENVICREQKVKNFCLCATHPNVSYWTEKCSFMQEAGFLVIYTSKGLPK